MSYGLQQVVFLDRFIIPSLKEVEVHIFILFLPFGVLR